MKGSGHKEKSNFLFRDESDGNVDSENPIAHTLLIVLATRIIMPEWELFRQNRATMVSVEVAIFCLKTDHEGLI